MSPIVRLETRNGPSDTPYPCPEDRKEEESAKDVLGGRKPVRRRKENVARTLTPGRNIV